MLNWTIETKRGCFQGNSLSAIINQMVEFYSINERDAEEITDVFAYDDGEVLQEISASEIKKVQEEIEERVMEWKENSKSEGGFRQTQNDYFLNLI